MLIFFKTSQGGWELHARAANGRYSALKSQFDPTHFVMATEGLPQNA
jgi:hypothetical protein